MTRELWIGLVEERKENLRSLIRTYHPVMPRGPRLPITAPNAEMACNQVRENIRKNFEGNPLEQFDEALKNKDHRKIYNLLSDAWFGVPESTSCWGITGFKEAVDLMDEPPDDNL